MASPTAGIETMLSSCLSLKETWKMRVEDCACCVWLIWVSKKSQHVSTASSKASPVCFSWNFILTSAVIPGNIRNYLWNHKIICKTWAGFAACFTAVSVSITEALIKFLLPVAPCSKPQVLFRFWIIDSLSQEKAKPERWTHSFFCWLWANTIEIISPIVYTYVDFSTAWSSVGI